jgi:anti-sigma-K factor RskA
MIPDQLQDQAALYLLGALKDDEQAEFEARLRENEELRAIVRELREASGDLALCVPAITPPPELKRRVLSEIALEKQSGGATRISINWLPWAIAALLLVFCGWLVIDRGRLQQEVADLRAVDPLAKVTLVSLASPTGELPETKAVVAWEPSQQGGVLTISHLPPAGAGRDYQLWTVDANRAEPISAGVIRVEPSGETRVRFKPEQNANAVKAFAISVEREGGVPKREGPIILIGST